MVPSDQTYGMAIVRYVSPFGNLMLINHPLLSHDAVLRQDIWGIDVEKLTFRYVDDTTLLKNRQNPGDDASKDEWLTEAGLEVHFSGVTPSDADGLGTTPGPSAHGRLKGIATYGG